MRWWEVQDSDACDLHMQRDEETRLVKKIDHPFVLPAKSATMFQEVGHVSMEGALMSNTLFIVRSDQLCMDMRM